MNQVLAHSMSPVHIAPLTSVWVILEIEMILTILIKHTVRVVHPSVSRSVMEIRTILLAILRIERIRELHVLPASEGVQTLLAIIAVYLDIESQALQTGKLIHIERHVIIYVVFSQLHIEGFHLLVVSNHLDICH